MTHKLKYLNAYAPNVISQIQTLINDKQLGSTLLKKYPKVHGISSSKALYDHTMAIKNDYLRKSAPLSKVIYDDKIHVIKDALGLHTYISRVQGKKLKAKSEIRISTLFKKVPIEFLNMIVVHELAHLKEKQHDKAFYKLCQHMEPHYHQFEFDLRLYLTQLDLFEPLY
jgi:predicted metal-dependent hydrolase